MKVTKSDRGFEFLEHPARGLGDDELASQSFSPPTKGTTMDKDLDQPIPKTIERKKLARLALCDSPDLPPVVNDDGRRRRWVGIGWVDEGPADGTETQVV